MDSWIESVSDYPIAPQDSECQTKHQNDLAGAIHEYTRDIWGQYKRKVTREEWQTFLNKWFKSTKLLII